MLSILALTLVLAPQYGMHQPIVDPADHSSPSGRFVLHVDPSDVLGRGEATYSMRRDGSPLWSTRHAFTLTEVAVTESGETFGYGLTGARFEGGELVVALLAQDGSIAMEDRRPLEMSRYLHSPDNPLPRGIVRDPSRGTFFVRIADPDMNRRTERWWRYSIDPAEEVGQLRPREHLPQGEADFVMIHDARPLGDSGLFLVQWWTLDFDRLPGSSVILEGASYTVMDDKGRVLWQHDLPTDFTVESDEEADDELEARVRAHGTILEVGSEGEFELWFVREGVRTRYELERDDGSDPGWRVVETSRVAWSPTADEESAEPERPPTVRLEPLESVELKASVDQAPPLLDGVRTWALDGDAGFLAVRHRQGERPSRLRLGRDGSLIDEQPFDPVPESVEGELLRWHHLGDDVWLVAVTRYGLEPTGYAMYRAEGRTGVIEEFAELDHPEFGGVSFDVEEVEPTGDGGFLALGYFHMSYTLSSALFRFAANGSILWGIGEDYQREDRLFSPNDVAFTTDGEVVVVSAVADRLQYFDGSGKYLRSVELAEAWGQEPRYPSGITAGVKGDVLVHNFNGDPPLWTMDRGDAPPKGWTPRLPDGRQPDALARNARFALDGTLWTSDGYSIVRLDADGVGVEFVGPRAMREAIVDPGLADILRDGRIAVRDDRTGAIHVWEESGERLFVSQVEPGDADHKYYLARIVSRPDGSIWIRTGGSGFGWSREGVRLGSKEFEESVVHTKDGESSWCWGSGPGIRLRDPDGVELLSIRRRPDDRWFRAILSAFCSDDGELTVLDTDLASSDAPANHIYRYSARGELIDSMSFPADWLRGDVLLRSGPWALLCSRWGPEVLLVDTRTHEARIVSVAGPEVDTTWAHGLSSDGKRLLSLDRTSLLLHRHELP